MALKTPTNLVATAFDSFTIDLSWIDTGNDENEFVIQRKDSGSWHQIAVVGAVSGSVSGSYVDGTCSPVTTYCYQVQAVNTILGTSSSFCSASCARTPRGF